MCKYCGKVLQKLHALKIHERIHTGTKPESCPHCDYKCISKTLIRKHIQSRHTYSNEEICDLCGKSFNTKDKLKRHIETHSDISETCPECGKLYRNLKRHLFVVHKHRYPCPECPRDFQAQLGLDTHRRNEHGIGLFKTE